MKRTAEEEEFRRRYHEHAVPVWGYVLRRVDDPDKAADSVAETFLVLWRRRGDLPAEAEIRPWLLGVARRVLANQRRGTSRRVELEDKLRSQLGTQLASLPLEHAADTITIRQALDSLDPDDRELLRLTSWEQLTPSEIAVVLDVPAATVRTRLHRARRCAKALLSEAGIIHSTSIERDSNDAAVCQTAATRQEGHNG